MIGLEFTSDLFNSKLRRYGFAIALFVAICILAAVLDALGVKLNLTILIVAGVVLASWFGGTGPGILLTILTVATAIAFNPVPPESTLSLEVLNNLSIIGIFIVLVLLVSGRKRVETRLREQSETLERRVKERTHELEVANRELESFAYSVSHDLRAPLRAISGFSHALLADYPDRLDSVGKGYLEQLSSSSKEMGQLIDDLLELSKVARSPMTASNVDLSAITRSILEKLHKEEPHRKAAFQITDEIVVLGDERLLTVALQNLLQNAWKFTAKVPAAEISFGQVRHSGAHEYFVRDNGAGFDMAYVGQLFGPFQRLHSVEEFEGTGIGLATVQRVIHRHGGSIRAEGELGKGSGFYFTL